MDFFSPQKIAACVPSSEERNGVIDETFIVDPTKSVLTRGGKCRRTLATDYFFYGHDSAGDPKDGGSSEALTGAYNGILPLGTAPIHGADLVNRENGDIVDYRGGTNHLEIDNLQPVFDRLKLAIDIL